MAETTGERIRQVRGHLSQIDFAARLGADKNTIGRYERGERTPDGDFLVRIQLEFGVSIDWLLTGSGTGSAQAAPASESGGVDEELFGRVTEAVSIAFKECGYSASLRQVAARAARIAAGITAAGGTPDQQEYGLRLAIDQLRRDLRAAIAEPGSEASTKSRA